MEEGRNIIDISKLCSENGIDLVDSIHPNKKPYKSGRIRRNGVPVVNAWSQYLSLSQDVIIYVTRENADKLLQRSNIPKDIKQQIIFNLDEVSDANGLISINISQILDKK